MSQEQTAYPLAWPLGWKRNTTRVHSRFGAHNTPPSVGRATTSLLLELRRLGVPDYQVIVSTNVQLRLDGLPYSNQREPSDPGAAVYFTLKEQKKVLACDKYLTVGENLYAIAKTIDATRGIERWGSVTTEQAFAGYVALQEKTERSAWEVLGIHNIATNARHEVVVNENVIMDAYRRKARETHPDTPGGSAEAFSEVCRAKDMALQLIQ